MTQFYKLSKTAKSVPLSEFVAITEKKKRDWLATNTDVITSQSRSCFPCSRRKDRRVENRLDELNITD
jgi:hypothetical protein